MPHLSKRKLERDVYLKIYEELNQCVTSYKNKLKREKFLEEILTITEKIMIAKRLAVMTMLVKGISSYGIEKSLKVSSSTVARLENMMEKGKFTNLQNFLLEKQKSKAEIIFGEISNFLMATLTSNRRAQWKWIADKMNEDE